MLKGCMTLERTGGNCEVKMARLVLDARESGTSTGRYVDKLVENLAKLKPNFEIIVLTKSQRVEALKQIAPNFKILAADYKEFSFFGEQLGLAWRLYRLRPALVHFSMTQQPLLYFGRSVTTVHDLTTARFRNPAKNIFVFKFKQCVYRFVIVWVAHKSQAILVPTEWVKNDLAGFARIKKDKIAVTYEAADKIEAAAQPIPGLKPGKFIAWVGRPLPHKNLARLTAAFGLVKKRHPDLKLALAGKKDVLYQKLEASAPNGVVIPGFLTDGQWRWFYENAAVYAYPSLSEGFGLQGLEAMLYSLPVVSSSATCLPEVYGEAALYFDPKNIDDMAAKINLLLDDKKLRTELIKKGSKQVRKYSWRQTAEQTLAVYQKSLTK